ncbi:tetratricopeptide repeat protein [Filobacillus milosensis]|uniref:Tetratricopeptide repeat protein n=1 Tax=Filobacillus milosensis TaxID=94137 RepID=A0A4Y8IRX8_9BACI|nr:tetratricopeptide repeat protein [Filobacillus milosensis]TFB21363.1 tetratricopeptide repeat protein [Filobacillus milosensis]
MNYKLNGHELELYLHALSGDQQAAQKAYEYFQSAHSENPTNLDYKIHYADCLSLQSRYSDDASDMIGKAISAMKLFDSVVNVNPKVIKYRYLRGYHALRLPEAFFHRTTTAIVDLEYLINSYKDDSTIFSKEIYFQLLYDLGVANLRMGDEEEAQEVWDDLLVLDPPQRFENMIDQQNNKQKYDYQLVDYSAPIRDEAKRIHLLGAKGNEQAVNLSYDLWSREYQANSKDPIVQAYFGSSTALLARSQKKPKEQFSQAMEGYMEIKKALEKDPDNLEILILRAFLINAFPRAFFDFGDQVIQDFEKLKSAYQKDHSVFSKETYHEILFQLGLAYEKFNKSWMSKIVWGELLRDNPSIEHEILLIERV